MNFLLKVFGPAKLIRMGYKVARPYLVRWAESDGEDDWDDALVQILDKVIPAAADKIEQEA